SSSAAPRTRPTSPGKALAVSRAAQRLRRQSKSAPVTSFLHKCLQRRLRHACNHMQRRSTCAQGLTILLQWLVCHRHRYHIISTLPASIHTARRSPRIATRVCHCFRRRNMFLYHRVVHYASCTVLQARSIILVSSVCTTCVIVTVYNIQLKYSAHCIRR